MKKAAVVVFALLLLVPTLAQAFSTRDALALVAMPLAVAAVADVNGVPQDRLANVLVTLNEANVQPTQFVEVVRYVPVTLVRRTTIAGPAFDQWIVTQTQAGLTGPALVTAIDQRLPLYGVTPMMTLDVEPTTFVMETDYIPTTVYDQYGYNQYGYDQYAYADPLSLVAMPLAVAAVADLAGVPQDQFADVLFALNQANVPPVQFVQVVRYVPVALVTDVPQQPAFVDWLQMQTSQGITGPALVNVIQQRMPVYGVQPQFARTAQRTSRARVEPVFVESNNYIPPEVRTRVAAVSHNPYGGPPGRLKRAAGLQTGAEIVHGYRPAHNQGGQSSAPQIAQRPVMMHGHGQMQPMHGNRHAAGGASVHPAPAMIQRPAMIQHPQKTHANQGGGHGHGRDHAYAAPVQQPVAIPRAMMSSAPAQVEHGSHGHGRVMHAAPMTAVRVEHAPQGHGRAMAPAPAMMPAPQRAAPPQAAPRNAHGKNGNQEHGHGRGH